jgi:hypothetical protein
MSSSIKIFLMLWLVIANTGLCHCYSVDIDDCTETHQNDSESDSQDTHECQCATCNVIFQSHSMAAVWELRFSETDRIFGETFPRIVNLAPDVPLQPPI